MMLKKMVIWTATCLSVPLAAAADDLVQQMVESSSWQTTSPTGGSVEIRFFPDGTGRAGSGLLSREFTWEGEGRRLCLSGLPGAASGCMMLTPSDKGLVGQREDGATILFW